MPSLAQLRHSAEPAQRQSWAHGRRKVFELADIAQAFQRKSRGKTPVVSPLALAAVSCYRTAACTPSQYIDIDPIPIRQALALP